MESRLNSQDFPEMFKAVFNGKTEEIQEIISAKRSTHFEVHPQDDINM
jgi:hypothetical protein